MLGALRRRFSADGLERLTIRGALLVGFLAIFTLWFLVGYNLDQRLTEVETRASTIHARFAQSEGLLLTVSAQVLLGSVYLRDAFLDPRPDAALFYRRELQSARTQIERALQQYVPDVVSAIEREHWTHLRTELHEYWDAMVPAITPEITRDSFQAQTFLRDRVVPKRQTIIQISEQIRSLNQDAFQRQDGAMKLLYRDMRRRIWAMSGIALVLGLAVAFGATRHAGRLESQIRQQHVQEVERQAELERLSAKLVHAQENERRTIARELHDEIGQALTALKIELSIAQQSAEASGKTADSLVEARSITDRALHAVRDMSQLLHPTTLDELGLAETTVWYLRSFAQRTGIRAELTQDRMAARMGPDVEICAYRIIQEALTNVAKHSQATACRVFLQRLPRSLLLTVEDDGRGFDLKRRSAAGGGPRGLGLVGIRERVSGLGGTFRMESALGTGTRLTAELPIAADDAHAGMTEQHANSSASVAERDG